MVDLPSNILQALISFSTQPSCFSSAPSPHLVPVLLVINIYRIIFERHPHPFVCAISFLFVCFFPNYFNKELKVEWIPERDKIKEIKPLS